VPAATRVAHFSPLADRDGRKARTERHAFGPRKSRDKGELPPLNKKS
jgi:hypothetical protein